MERQQSSSARGVDRFRTTRWSIVLLSAQSQAPGYKEALSELCKLYWYPIYAFVRRQGHSPENAQDLTQGFFLDLLEHKALRRVDRQNGKFRSFLLASLRYHFANEARSARCLKRGAQVEFVHLDTQNMQNAENRYGREEPIEVLTPEKIFDARWATALLGEARKRLSLEYAAEGKAATFEALIEYSDDRHRRIGGHNVTSEIGGSNAARNRLHPVRGVCSDAFDVSHVRF